MSVGLRGWRRACVLSGLLVLAASCSSGGKSATFKPVRAPDAFASVRVGAHGSHAVTISDATTGRVQSVVLPDPWHGMEVDSTAVDSVGRLWVTLTSGPRCTSNVNGCGPLQDSCSGEVITIDPATGKRTTVFKALRSELIGDAQPSPDRRLVAYLDGSCNNSYFNQHLQIRDLASGRSWSIGTGLVVCHSLGSIAWTRDGASLAVFYGPSTVAAGDTPSSYGYGSCKQSAPRELAVVPALQAATGLPARTMAVDANCEAEAVTTLRDGYAAIEGCAKNNNPINGYISGPAFLLVIDSTFHITSRSQIGMCVDGAELRAGTSGSDLLGTSYQFCNPPGTSQPRYVTFVDIGNGPHNVIDVPNEGSSSVSAISW
jgi:hypothetical protein